MNKSCSIVLLFTTLLNVSFAQNWTQLSTTGNISPRANASAVYDETNNTMYVFGGITSNGTVNDLWALDLNTNIWSEIPTNSMMVPQPRFTHICMFDANANRILMWSGNGASLFNDIWAFNLNDSTWEELFPDGNVSGAPLKRYGVATVFDPVNRNIVTYAGFTTSGRFDDTWTFNIDSMSWIDKTNSNFPLQRCLTSQSFAEDRREMFVFGGQSTGNLNDIWKLNLDNYTWTDLTPAQLPPARHYTSNVYCGNHIVIFGGNLLNQGNNAGATDDLWSFSLSSNTWDTVPQGLVKPSARFGHTYIYLPNQDKMIIFGGQGSSALNAETWVYEGISSLLNDVKEQSSGFHSLQAFPNPATDQVTLSFQLPVKSELSISLFNFLGKEIRIIKEIEFAPGQHRHMISFANLNAGIYFLRVGNKIKFESIRILKTD